MRPEFNKTGPQRGPNKEPINPRALAKGVMDSLFQAPRYSRLILGTLFSPILIFFALIGNGILLVCTGLFFKYENGINPDVTSFLDSLWWSLATVTTVGYGDIVPVTEEGRIIGLVAMLLGVVFFVGSTALFVSLLFARMNRDLVTTRLLTYQEIEEVLNTLERLEKKIETLDERISTKS